MPDHYPDDPYPLDEIRSAAQFVLHGTSSAAFENRSDASQPPALKTEDITKFLALINALTPQSQQSSQPPSRPRPPPPPRAPRMSNPNGDVPNVCAFCGIPGHWKSECLVLDQYIKDGKVAKDANNFLALPSGTRLPVGLQGRSLKERFDEYYRQNPITTTAPSTTTLMYSLSPSPPESPYAPRSMLTNTTAPDMSDLSLEERNIFLEQEVLALRNGKKYEGPDGTTRTRKFPGRPSAPPATTQRPSSTSPPTHVPAPAPTPVPAPTTTMPVPAKVPPTSAIADNAPPIHPFAGVRETTYLPPHERNFATSAPVKPAKAKEPAYHTSAPIQNDKIVNDVYARAMSSPCITISPHELLSISPDARAKIRENVTPRRTPTDPVVSTNVLRSPDPAPDDPLPFANNALISTDPVEVYMNSLKPNETAGPFVVAKESHALRSIVVQVDNQKSVESVVDPGSQIIAMSEDVCHSLGLPYDPSIILHMQSANGEVDKSLGLARNVPCTVGSVTLYLQIHVIRSPAYDILLGRPFDVLTESTVQNYSNEDQTITIADPNSNRTVTIPTIARGQHKKLAKPPDDSQPAMGFRSSRL